ncbi:hypothetical protein BDB01DRAFT_800654 [Pilobolus umbonatus]|nr:hypothetical protein BDB01DRAFT_800654 [Pilobolus umbonatus]
MTDNWDRTVFDKDLKSILETKLPISASKITSLQALATAHPQHHNYIIQCITRFIETAPPDYRLAGLYVIDAISRYVHKRLRKKEDGNGEQQELEGFLKRFAIVLKDDSLIGCFDPCSTKDKEKVKKTLDIWEQGSIYSKELVQYVKHSFLKGSGGETDNSQVKVAPVDPAFLTTLQNIGNGSLANLNIPGITPVQQEPRVEDNATLPPALAKLLGGLVSNTVDTSTADPRIRVDPRQKSQSGTWPPPQGPSIPPVRNERKTRWGSAVTPSIQEPFVNRPSMTDSRLNSYESPSYRPPPTYTQKQQQQLQQQLQQQVPPPPPLPFQPSFPAVSTYQPPTAPSYPSTFQSYWPPSYGNTKTVEPYTDNTLPPGCIKVLTRTLFIGPVPDHYEKEDVANLFSKYGEIASVILSKKLKGRHNAFLKFRTRAATEVAKQDCLGLIVEDVPVKVNWAYGFGPKKHFDYDTGHSIIPLSELNDEEKDNLVRAPVGGFQGQPLRDLMVIEEPEAQYRPEWKHPENKHGMGDRWDNNGVDDRSYKRMNGNHEDSYRKRSRFDDNGNHGYRSQQRRSHQDHHSSYSSYDPPSFNQQNNGQQNYAYSGQ